MNDDPKSGYLILGAGGHGKVVADAIRACGWWPQTAFLDADPHRIGTEILGTAVLGDDSFLTEARVRGFTHFIVGMGTSGDSHPRRILFDKGRQAGLEAAIVVHPTAVCAPSAKIGDGTVILAGATLNADCMIGRNVVVNTGAIVEHDCRIGDHAMIAPAAVLLGGCNIGAGAFIGAGAVIRQEIPVGENAIVGVGAVVLEPVPAGARVAGVPARPITHRD